MNKNLLALSAVAAASLAFSASAATSNIVGYVKVSLKKGLNLINNPLKASNPSSDVVYAALGDGSRILSYNGVSFDIYENVGGDWTGTVDAVPGKALFVDVPADIEVTFVGDAQTGTQTVPFVTGNNFIGSKIPLGGTTDATAVELVGDTGLGFTPVDGDQILTWNGTSYDINEYVAPDWTGGSPKLKVQQGFVLVSPSAGVWTKTFTPL